MHIKRLQHCGLVVRDLEQHGIEILGGPMLRGDGAEQFYFHDPDGFLLECYHWVDNDMQEAPERGAIHG